MDILQETKEVSKNSFFGHVFSSSEEDKAEYLNVIQYSAYALIPIVVLNKLIQRFIPEADPDKSSLEILIEILIQIVVIFCGIIVIHRVITYFPTYSGFKYENLTLTNVVLAFLIIVLSIQSKLGTKANILVDRVNGLWDGSSDSRDKKSIKDKLKVSKPVSSYFTANHSPSQSDFLDNSGLQNTIFPPAPATQNKKSTDSYDYMMKGDKSSSSFFGGGGGSSYGDYEMSPGPVAANAVLGSSFGAY